MSTLVAEQRVHSLRDRVLRDVPPSDWRHVLWYVRGDAKYGEPFWIAERLKIALRRRWCKEVAQIIEPDFATANARSLSFWEEYEEVNRLWLPDDPVYTGNRNGITLSTTADAFTLTAGSSGQHRILEIFIGGEATTSTVARMALNRPSTGGTTPTNQTAEKVNTRSPASVSTFATTWTTQPTLSTNDLINQAFNAFGGTDRWSAQPGGEIYQVNSEQVSYRSRSGTPAVSTHVFWEEL